MWTPNPALPHLYPCYMPYRYSDLALLTFLSYHPLSFSLLSEFLYIFFIKTGSLRVLKNVPTHPHNNINTLELPLSSSSFFSFCGFEVEWVENWTDVIKVGGFEEYIGKITCRCQSRSLGLFSMEKRTDCSRNVDKLYLKDLKQCLQNLFLKREKKM